MVRELKLKFTGNGEVKGFEYTCLKMTDSGYLYRVECYNRVWYEVFRRKVGVYGVRYPRSKSFGVWAWSYSCIGRAVVQLMCL